MIAQSSMVMALTAWTAAAAADVVVLLGIYSLSYANGFGQMSIFQGENIRPRGGKKENRWTLLVINDEFASNIDKSTTGGSSQPTIE